MGRLDRCHRFNLLLSRQHLDDFPPGQDCALLNNSDQADRVPELERIVHLQQREGQSSALQIRSLIKANSAPQPHDQAAEEGAQDAGLAEQMGELVRGEPLHSFPDRNGLPDPCDRNFQRDRYLVRLSPHRYAAHY